MIIETILLLTIMGSHDRQEPKYKEEIVSEQRAEYERLGIPKYIYYTIVKEATELYPTNYYMQNFRIEYQCEEYLKNQKFKRGL